MQILRLLLIRPAARPAAGLLRLLDLAVQRSREREVVCRNRRLLSRLPICDLVVQLACLPRDRTPPHAFAPLPTSEQLRCALHVSRGRAGLGNRCVTVQRAVSNPVVWTPQAMID